MKFLNNLIYIILAVGSTLFAFQVLSTLYTTTIESPDGESFGVFANSVSSIGDINNDGYSEFIVGAPGENPNGRAYIFNGANYDTLFTVTQPPQNVIDFGISVSGAGDVNNDGINDFIVGSDYHANQMAFVYSGATGDTLFEMTSPLAMFSGGGFGRAVSGAGDVNNDGYDDVLVGASEEFPFGLNRAGRAYIFSGLTGDTLYTLVSPDTMASGYFGHSVAAIGDINNDGFDDVIVGAYNQSITFFSAGNAYIFSGFDGDTLFSLNSAFSQNAGNFGWSVSGAGDVNNDGTNDVIVGARQETVGGNSVAGRAYVFSGSTGAVIYTISSPNPTTFGYFGNSVAGVGDINNDNYDDVFVGAFHEGVLGIARSGRGYIFSGATGDTLCSLQSLNPEQDGRFGWTASSAGDINNDGIGDVIVGAVGELGGYPTGHGRAYLFSINPLSGFDDEFVQEVLPQKFELYQNYPNPFNPSTTISFVLPKNSNLEINIYDELGKRINKLYNSPMNAGYQKLTWNGTNEFGHQVSSGVYFYTVKAITLDGSSETFSKSSKLLLLR